jgi:hypothetical protein
MRCLLGRQFISPAYWFPLPDRIIVIVEFVCENIITLRIDESDTRLLIILGD